MTDLRTGGLAGIAIVGVFLGFGFLLASQAGFGIALIAVGIGAAIVRGQGGPKIRICPSCGTRVASVSEYCPSCGRSFARPMS